MIGIYSNPVLRSHRRRQDPVLLWIAALLAMTIIISPAHATPVTNGLQLWFDASNGSTITSDANGVSQWNDLSGNNNHALQSTNADKPSTGALTQNGKNVLRFSSDHMTLTSPACTIGDTFQVIKTPIPGFSYYGAILGSTLERIYLFDTSNQTDFHTSPSVVWKNASEITGGHPNDLTTTHEWMSLLLVPDSGVTATQCSLLISENNYEVPMDVAEVISYNKILSESERFQVLAYLHNKWAVSGPEPSLSPDDNHSHHPRNGNLVMNFNMNMNTGSGDIRIKKISDDSTVETIGVSSGLVTGNGTASITINPSTTLDFDTDYYIEIDSTGFTSVNGSVPYLGINDSYSWNFRTEENGSGTFTVNDLNGLWLWLDASNGTSITSDANGVSQWNDLSANNNHALQTTNNDKPATGAQTQNSRNVLNFVSDHMVLTNPDCTIGDTFHVLKTPTPGFNSHGVALGSTFERIYLFDSSSATDFHTSPSVIWKNASEITSGHPNDLTKTHEWMSLMMVPDSGVTYTQCEIMRGEQFYETNMDLAEVVAYDRLLSNSERSQVFAYLHSKWGISGPQASFNPDDNHSHHPRNGNLVMNFNVNMSTGSGDIRIKKSDDDSLIETIGVSSGLVTGNGTASITINPNTTLDFDTDYYIEIDTTAFAAVNGSVPYLGINDKQTWNFKTVENGDNNFTVDDLNGLWLWLDASNGTSITSDANGVSQWNDLSANRNHALQTNNSDKPTTGAQTQNSRNVFNFSSDYMVLTNPLCTVGDTFHVVKTPTPGFNNHGILLGSTLERLYLFDSSSATDFHTSPSVIWKNSRALTGGHPNDLIQTHEWMSLMTLPDSGVTDSQCEVLRGEQVYKLNMDVAEIVAFDRTLSDSERYQVFAYLHNKWAIPGASVDNFIPADNHSHHPLSNNLIINFDSNYNAVSGNIRIKKSDDDSLVETIAVNSGLVTGNGTSAITINPNTNFDYDTDYYIEIDSTAFSSVNGGLNYIGISDKQTWNFKTAENGDDGFTINDINGLALWLDASNGTSITSDANGVSQWNDLSANRNHALQSANNDKPVTGAQTQDSKNIINFTSDYMSFTNPSCTIGDTFQVIKTPTPTFNTHGAILGSTVERIYLFDSSGQTDFHTSPSVVWKDAKALGGHPNNLSQTHEWMSLLLLPKNGVTNSQCEVLRIEQFYKIDMDVAEIISFNQVLSEGDRFKVLNYLHNKWALPILADPSYSPADNSSAVTLNTNLTLTFAENIDIQDGNLTILKANGSVFETIGVDSAQVTGNGTTTITVNPNKTLAAGQSYYINLQGESFTDITNGNKAYTGIYDSTSWNFSTESFTANWTKKNKITIKAAEVNGDLSNFPVYINLAHMPGSFFSNVKGNGADIRITKPDFTTQLPFELVELDTNNGSGELWFKADSLSGSTDTDFYIWYGNNGAAAYAASDTYGSQNTWSNGFLAVYHMNEDPNGDVVDSVLDSTTSPSHGDPAGSMTTADLVNGQLGRAIEFDGSNDRIRIALGNAGPLTTIATNNGTITAWATHTGSANYRWLISNWNTTGLHFGLCPSGMLCGYFGNSAEKNTNYTMPSDGSWHHYTARRTSGTMELFADATSNGTFAGLSGTFSSPNVTDLGSRNGGASQFWTGSIDELKVSNTARSNNWIKTEYNNQNSPSTFYEITGDGGDIFGWSLF